MKTKIYELSSKTGMTRVLDELTLWPREALEHFYEKSYTDGQRFINNPYIKQVEDKNIYYYQLGDILIYTAIMEDESYVFNN